MPSRIHRTVVVVGTGIAAIRMQEMCALTKTTSTIFILPSRSVNFRDRFEGADDTMSRPIKEHRKPLTAKELSAEQKSNAEHGEIAQLAYQLWQERGCPTGSPEDDWNRAQAELVNRSKRRVY